MRTARHDMPTDSLGARSAVSDRFDMFILSGVKDYWALSCPQVVVSVLADSTVNDPLRLVLMKEPIHWTFQYNSQETP